LRAAQTYEKVVAGKRGTHAPKKNYLPAPNVGTTTQTKNFPLKKELVLNQEKPEKIRQYIQAKKRGKAEKAAANSVGGVGTTM